MPADVYIRNDTSSQAEVLIYFAFNSNGSFSLFGELGVRTAPPTASTMEFFRRSNEGTTGSAHIGYI